MWVFLCFKTHSVSFPIQIFFVRYTPATDERRKKMWQLVDFSTVEVQTFSTNCWKCWYYLTYLFHLFRAIKCSGGQIFTPFDDWFHAWFDVTITTLQEETCCLILHVRVSLNAGFSLHWSPSGQIHTRSIFCCRSDRELEVINNSSIQVSPECTLRLAPMNRSYKP